MTQSKVETKLNQNGNRRGMNLKSQNNIKLVKRIGRPKKDDSLLEYIRKQLLLKCPYDTKDRTWLEALADAELRTALSDTTGRRNLFDRLLGRPVETVVGSGEITLRWKEDAS